MVYIFTISCGFTVSHVYCPKGERWIIGSKMPPAKHGVKHDKNHQKRNIDTFNIKFDFETLASTSPIVKQISVVTDIVPISPEVFVYRAFSFDEQLAFINRPPPDWLFKPDLHKIQVLKI